MEPVGIIGAGAFGLALARTIALAGRPVLVHVPDFESARRLAERRESPRVPGVALPESIRVESDLAAIARHARFLVLAVPGARVPATIDELGLVVDGAHVLVHASGALPGRTEETIVPEEAGEVPADHARVMRVSELIRRRTVLRQIGALAGPALPGDLLAGRPCGMVVASPYSSVIRAARALLGVPPALRIYESAELAGVELASALSGAMAVAIGIADGIELGEGPRAVGITRAVAEMARIGATMQVPERVFSGLAGLGNLLARTSPISSKHSDDYQLGIALARAGRTSPDLRPTPGAEAARAGAALAKRHGVVAPLCGMVSAILDGEPVSAAVQRVMSTLPELE